MELDRPTDPSSDGIQVNVFLGFVRDSFWIGLFSTEFSSSFPLTQMSFVTHVTDNRTNSGFFRGISSSVFTYNSPYFYGEMLNKRYGASGKHVTLFPFPLRGVKSRILSSENCKRLKISDVNMSHEWVSLGVVVTVTLITWFRDSVVPPKPGYFVPPSFLSLVTT